MVEKNQKCWAGCPTEHVIGRLMAGRPQQGAGVKLMVEENEKRWAGCPTEHVIGTLMEDGALMAG